MKTKLIKDIPIGVLLIVLSLYCVVGVSYLTSIPSVGIVLIIMLLSVLSFKFILVGFDLLFGIEIKDDK